MIRYNTILASFAIGLILLGAAGCGFFGAESDDITAFDSPAQVLANEAEQLYLEAEYEDAADMYKALMDRYPYSRFKLLAELRLGDAYLKAKRYEEAEAAFEEFIRLHPQNEAVPYALYQMGMTYHAQMSTADRDPTPANKALKAFRRLSKEHPKSEWSAKALPRITEVQRLLAGHDLFVGKFYYRTQRFNAAIGRFKQVITKYPDVGLYNEAIRYMEKSRKMLAKYPHLDKRSRVVDRRDLFAPVAEEQPDVNDKGLEDLESGGRSNRP